MARFCPFSFLSLAFSSEPHSLPLPHHCASQRGFKLGTQTRSCTSLHLWFEAFNLARVPLLAIVAGDCWVDHSLSLSLSLFSLSVTVFVRQTARHADNAPVLRVSACTYARPARVFASSWPFFAPAATFRHRPLRFRQAVQASSLWLTGNRGISQFVSISLTLGGSLAETENRNILTFRYHTQRLKAKYCEV